MSEFLCPIARSDCHHACHPGNREESHFYLVGKDVSGCGELVWLEEDNKVHALPENERCPKCDGKKLEVEIDFLTKEKKKICPKCFSGAGIDVWANL